MDVTRQQIVTEALRWIGTPFQHNQSCLGKGCDCIGLVIGVFKNLGCLPSDYFPAPYSQQWHAHKNEELLLHRSAEMGFIPKDGQPAGADLLVFKFGRVCSHAGIYLGDGSFVHAYFSLHRAVRQPLRGEMQARMQKVLSCPWVID